ncbi:hypothetical protein SADO_06117 [Salinisphaera dokdonensis CL-ES53]|uniref:SHOCT domain-containing protein n=1 Tax=Salinisphaera dokdonensis CL-ES53 TaxID=1304272 RepID=A0ABV2AYS0_9GAMM
MLGVLAVAAITAGCSGLPAAPGSSGDGAPPAYVNVVNTEEMLVQLVPQDSGAARRNDHPAAFEPQQLAALLMSLRVRGEDHGSASTISSPSRLERLGAAVSKALVRASPRQDVGFVVYRRGQNGLFSGSSRYATSGRAFYQGDQLNLIFGEFDQAFSEFRDLSINEFKYGTRAQSARVGGERLVASDAWAWHEGRRDWIEMSATAQAIEAARQSAPRVIEASASSSAKPLQYGPAAASAPQAEPASASESTAPMAAQTSTTAAPTPKPAPAAASSSSTGTAAAAASGGAAASSDWTRIEDRLTQLKRLREKNLISEQDYQSKKDELLSQLP